MVSSDGYYLLSWDEVKEKHSSKYSGPVPRWFSRFKQDFTFSQHRQLTHPLPDVQVFNLPIKQPSINNSLPVERPTNEWVYFWDDTKRDIVLGKTVSRENDSSSSITYFQHYIPILCSSRLSSTFSTYDPVTPT
ncbi:hypothetical protein RCL_jg17587.t1 [Rhizophagus clarus]|nr:hypothetical protein RCL_jg17587.t1 [Rhizophagus clarus]